MRVNFPWNLAQRSLALALVVLMCGGPQLLAQTAQNTPPSSNNSQAQQQQQPTTPSQSNSQQQQQVAPTQKPSQSLDVDPSKGPLQPVPSSTPENQPAVSPSSEQSVNAPTPQSQTQKPQPPAPAPQGVAAAGEAKTNGGPASEPAGTAIAPAKQHQTRSLLIKIGAIGAGAAALGAIYGLSRGTPSHPPNTAVGATQAH